MVRPTGSTVILDPESSRRIDSLRFPMIVGVVFVHANETSVRFAEGTIGTSQGDLISDFIRNLISNGLARTAVPLFFLISGYFLLAGCQSFGDQYWAKLKRRTRTLFVPFMFWNIATLVLVALAQNSSITHAFFSGRNRPIASYTAFDYVNAVFGVTRMPIAYQFWFIRDLMLLVLVSPVIVYANRALPLLFLSGLGASWLLGVWPVYAPSGSATLFFSLGAYLAASRTDLFAGDTHGSLFITVYLAVVVVDALLMREGMNLYLHRVGIVLGILAVLSVTRSAVAWSPLRQSLLWLNRTSFFVYAAHEPLLTVARKAVYRTLPQGVVRYDIVFYFVIPILVILILIASHQVLSHMFPIFMKTVTGQKVRAYPAGVATR